MSVSTKSILKYLHYYTSVAFDYSHTAIHVRVKLTVTGTVYVIVKVAKPSKQINADRSGVRCNSHIILSI